LRPGDIKQNPVINYLSLNCGFFVAFLPLDLEKLGNF